MNNLGKSITYLEEVERAAQFILEDKQEIIELSKRHNMNREELWAIQKDGKRTHFISIGNLLIKTENETYEQIIKQDQPKIDSHIKGLRDGLRAKVNRLRDLEHKPPVPGLLLAPLSKDELN